MAERAARAVLKIDDLQVYYGESHALQGVSLTLESGVLSVVGRNGMGKSTLCNTITGLKRARSGSIRVNGREISSLDPHEIHRLGRQPGRGEGLLHMHQRVVVAGIHQRGPAALLDQVDRCHVGAVVARLHRIDAVTESCQTLHCHPPSCICKGPILARLEVYRRPPASRL